mmetsp:Transcript_9924/g.17275  ORF Transcript_9924/g.17275 Transcript_9924/m.17275 type:complete len:227 (-) Transcript_9924:645-1325(-)
MFIPQSSVCRNDSKCYPQVVVRWGSEQCSIVQRHGKCFRKIGRRVSPLKLSKRNFRHDRAFVVQSDEQFQSSMEMQSVQPSQPSLTEVETEENQVPIFIDPKSVTAPIKKRQFLDPSTESGDADSRTRDKRGLFFRGFGLDDWNGSLQGCVGIGQLFGGAVDFPAAESLEQYRKKLDISYDTVTACDSDDDCLLAAQQTFVKSREPKSLLRRSAEWVCDINWIVYY